MFKLEIKTSGAAYCDPYTGEEDALMEETQIAHDLRSIADRIANGQRNGVCMDINGNKVGKWSLD